MRRSGPSRVRTAGLACVLLRLRPSRRCAVSFATRFLVKQDTGDASALGKSEANDQHGRSGPHAPR
eukprot:937610-Pleurochrysis_carterae.AAC.2